MTGNETRSWRDVRPVALGVPVRGDEVLLAEHRDPSLGETFYRPVGGGVEFGERSVETVAREFGEELDVAVADAALLDTRERTFEFDGAPGHEIWFLYAVDLVEDWPYERDSFTGREHELDETFPVAWHSLEWVAATEDPIYPGDLPALLDSADELPV